MTNFEALMEEVIAEYHKNFAEYANHERLRDQAFIVWSEHFLRTTGRKIAEATRDASVVEQKEVYNIEAASKSPTHATASAQHLE